MTTPNLPNKDAIAERKQIVDALSAAMLEEYNFLGPGIRMRLTDCVLDLLTTTANQRVEQFAAELMELKTTQPIGGWFVHVDDISDTLKRFTGSKKQ